MEKILTILSDIVNSIFDGLSRKINIRDALENPVGHLPIVIGEIAPNVLAVADL